MTEPLHPTIRSLLRFIYGEAQGGALAPRLARLLETFTARHGAPTLPGSAPATERDVVLITYGDMLSQPGQTPLAALHDFLTAQAQGIVNTVHILPFFPYTSDDGFSVVDYREVNPDLGSWRDVEQLGADFRLMFDLVLNHMSAHSEWFRAFLRGDQTYRDYFVTADAAQNLSNVVRPRTHPLLTPFETADGTRHVWTTFSADQVDLNFANPDVLLEMIGVLLFYVERGAALIRLDAIAYLWKEIGTACIHHPKTHAVVQLLRAVVDQAAPGVLLITETNVPHDENISYFGDGTNEAHLVYQFALPPLVAHTLLAGSARRLRDWASTLQTPSAETTFFNFTASHDGIGVRPAAGILSDSEIAALINATLANGGQVSYKTNADGSHSPYELNIVYYSLLNPPRAAESQAAQVSRFLCSQAIMLALEGVPGIYFHNLFGSRNFTQGVEQTGQPRTINREKLTRAALEAELADPASVRHAVFDGYRRLIAARIGARAFHPGAAQQVIDAGDSLFALLRTSPEGHERVLALHNVTAQTQRLTLDLRPYGLSASASLRDLITSRPYPSGAGSLAVELDPYQVVWLRSSESPQGATT